MVILRYILPLFILLLSINLLIFNNNFYEKESNNLTISNNIIDYFKGNELNQDYISEKEVSHMNDVRNLVWISLIILISLLILIIFLKKSPKEVFYAGIISLMLTMLLILIFFSFSSSFIYFHKIFFTNNNWLLPASSTLIQTFPESFFQNATKQIILYNIILSLFALIIGCKTYKNRA